MLISSGITRVSKESIFSDLNNLTVVTTTSDKYATAFGFTEEEGFAALDSQGFDASEKNNVKFWYDGFTFGRIKDIYNPWSVTMFLDTKKYGAHWANTSGNGLVGKLIQEGDKETKVTFEALLRGKCIEAQIDEQIIYNQLDDDSSAIWSLLLASGYLKVEEVIAIDKRRRSTQQQLDSNLQTAKQKAALIGRLMKDYQGLNVLYILSIYKRAA